MTQAAILGMHYCVPRGVLSHDELVERFGLRAVAAIERMSGIKERRIAAADQTAVDLAVFAAEEALKVRPDWRQEIDAVIFCSQTGDYVIPPSACVLHGRLGLQRDCLSFDVQHGCPSFLVGLSLAKSLVESGAKRLVLLVNADTLTKVIHPMDRSLVPLHGDGAAVTFIGRSDSGAIGRIEHGTDGAGHEFLMIPASGCRVPRTAATHEEVTDASGGIRTAEQLQMDGAAVYQFSIHTVPDAIDRFVTAGDLPIAAYANVLLHQANKMMLDAIYERVGAEDRQRQYFLETVGNTSAASLPMLVANGLRTRSIEPSTTSLLAAFGVGLAWGVGEVSWGDVVDFSSCETDC